MPRVIWKGAVSFGLVHVPVALYPASSEGGIDFDWLDQRTMDPVGYKRVNKRTGDEVENVHIVRGVKVAGGDYVVLGDDEIKAAYPRTTQTIEIESFVKPTEIPFTLLEKPYYLEPIAKGEKVYALLREALRAAGVVGISRVVMHAKEHLAVLAPVGPALVLNTLRWHHEVRPWNELNLPPEGVKAAALKEGELKMAGQLIRDMTETWHPERYDDRFTKAVLDLVDQRATAGETEAVQPLEETGQASASNVLDLTDLLRRSLSNRRDPEPPAPQAGAARAAPVAKAATKKAPKPAAKPATRRRA